MADDRQPSLTPTSYIVLGLLELYGEGTPYDLKARAAASIGNFWSVPHSALYAEPERLAEAGYLVERREAFGRRRKLYYLTDQGRQALEAWREAPTEGLPELRDPGLLKLFFGADVARSRRLAARRISASSPSTRRAPRRWQTSRPERTAGGPAHPGRRPRARTGVGAVLVPAGLGVGRVRLRGGENRRASLCAQRRSSDPGSSRTARWAPLPPSAGRLTCPAALSAGVGTNLRRCVTCSIRPISTACSAIRARRAHRCWSCGCTASSTPARRHGSRVDTLLEELDTEPVAEFDIDQLLDYRARRPSMRFDRDRWASYETPELALYLVGDADGAPFLLLTGPEPDVQWERFARAVDQLTELLGIELTIGLNAIPLAVPHTRPMGVTTHATRPELVEGHARWFGTVRRAGQRGARWCSSGWARRARTRWASPCTSRTTSRGRSTRWPRRR